MYENDVNITQMCLQLIKNNNLCLKTIAVNASPDNQSINQFSLWNTVLGKQYISEEDSCRIYLMSRICVTCEILSLDVYY